ncbi:hypothetical protein [Planctomicrobium sp. SH664]|uniref:hypothetical protein n=1 Tax=Planctomicrobium sp. SH664 TaxID=3448125 RepID=UPI003F5B3AC6
MSTISRRGASRRTAARGWRDCALTLGSLLSLPSLAFAQAGSAPLPSRPLWLESAVTVIMIGLVAFAVCRSSNRT